MSNTEFIQYHYYNIKYYIEEKNRKTYPLTEEGIKKMEMDKRGEKIGKITSAALYLILAYCLISGILGMKFLVNLLAGNLASFIVKVIIR